jgi:colanic acid/amylovoran biosynthesis glycosyltransferase
VQQAALAAKAARLQLSQCLAGQIAHQELRLHLRREAARAVLINVSASEGNPVSMMQAMACAIPCVGTSVGGVSEIIRDNVNGFLLPADPSPADVRLILRRYWGLPSSRRTEMRSAALSTWRERFDARRNYGAFAEHLAALA